MTQKWIVYFQKASGEGLQVHHLNFHHYQAFLENHDLFNFSLQCCCSFPKKCMQPERTCEPEPPGCGIWCRPQRTCSKSSFVVSCHLMWMTTCGRTCKLQFGTPTRGQAYRYCGGFATSLKKLRELRSLIDSVASAAASVHHACCVCKIRGPHHTYWGCREGTTSVDITWHGQVIAECFKGFAPPHNTHCTRSVEGMCNSSRVESILTSIAEKEGGSHVVINPTRLLSLHVSSRNCLRHRVVQKASDEGLQGHPI